MGLPFIKTPKAASPIEEAKQVPIECPFDEEPNPPPEKSAIRFWILSFGICLGLFLSVIDSSIVATALFTIGNDFKDLEAINWIALAYTLAYLGCAVAFAHVSDVIGRRDAFLLASVLFFAFSMASGFAQNIHQLIALRTIQGIGGSGLYSLTMWRWIFWINGPIAVVSMTIFLLAWPSKSQHNPPSRLQWKNFDFFGTLLIIAASVLIVFAFQRAGETSRNIFSSSIFIAPLTTGLLCWGGVFVWAFLVESGRFGAGLVPALPFKLFRNRHYTSAALTTLLIGYPYLQIIFTFPSRAQIVSGKSVMMSGLELLPLVGGSALGSVIGGCGLLSTVQGRADDAKALGFLVFAGLGFGLSTAAATMLVTFEAAIADAASAHGILAQMRILGGSIGIATATILLRNKLSDVSKGPISAIVEQDGAVAMSLAYSSAFRAGMKVCSILSGIAVMVSILGFRRTRMDMNEQRAKLFREEEIRRANERPQ
ncbi:putative transporter C3H1.06c [Beauveria bassiana D1-5]|uniref:Putative transporter C3H1.06c n=1 Tax=Beauveria bassiana D1-5 TaxID=1245745 RepID=A0A0A2VQH8_BEABA|nr:putative transporter C3H1.06c [Beauveria bassiana D1-5]